MARMNSFTKMNSLILALLIPVLIMYTISHQVSVGVIQQNLQDSQMNKLSFLLKQLDDNVRQLSMMANVLLKDPNVKEFRDLDLYGDEINVLKTEQIISQKLNLQSVANAFSNSVVIYAPRIQKAVGQNSLVYYDREQLYRDAKPQWRYDSERGQFVLYTFDPINSKSLVGNARLIAKVSFNAGNIVKMLDNYHVEGSGETFLYRPADGELITSGFDPDFSGMIVGRIGGRDMQERGNHTVAVNGADYLVNYVKSAELGWYLVDYVPLQKILAPVTESRTFFYLFLGIMLLVSITISYVLYQNIRIPIKNLIRSVQQLKKGNYATRISMKGGNDFTFLIQRFNEMAEQIENLVGKVYAEEIRSREATMKQLQSQINPHFLYNCLAFMKSMAILENNDAIVAMSVHLSKYYRYTTRNEQQLVPMREEIELVRHYLAIQNLQNKRLSYTIEIPDAMLDLLIPRLLIQPVVENAILHGIERHAEAGRIRISGVQLIDENRITVEDDGPGMNGQELQALARRLNLPLTEEVGCGLWNVHQRLKLQFEAGSGLRFEAAELRGLKVSLHWK
ncbi:sensor histidine kinase [Paenibacillus sp. GCM10027626]|uniref:cache domain-containing sensor histidine kinase n=1 Tax=Paenibacillus sp. GCM10027626 TaxID=3273411 RepID=UPI00363F75C5